MSFYKNAWAPGLAIPKYVDGEPFGRGTFTTEYLRRRTFLAPPAGWTAGYAIPQNVKDAPPGTGSLTTKQIKRRTISEWIPDGLMHRGKGDGVVLAQTPPGGALSGLGAVDITTAPVQTPGFPGDPIAQYGRELAAYIINLVKMLPASERIEAMRASLEQIDPKLWNAVASKAEALEKKGVASKTALQRALAASLADGFAREIIQIGLTGKVPRSGQVGATAFGAPEPLGGFWSKLKGVAKSVGNKMESLGCKVLNSPVAGYAAGVAGTSAGIPPTVGAAGVQLAASAACGSGGAAAPAAAPAPAPYPYPPPASGLPIVPIAIGGVAVIAAVLLLRKK
jgi:hypothetical protein